MAVINTTAQDGSTALGPAQPFSVGAAQGKLNGRGPGPAILQTPGASPNIGLGPSPAPPRVLGRCSAMELLLARIMGITLQQLEILQRVERTPSNTQNIDWACEALLEVFQDYDERDGFKLQDWVRQSYWEWRRARQLEGYSPAVQRRSWRLLCLEVALAHKVEVIGDRMDWVEVVKRDRDKSREERELNLRGFHSEDSFNMRVARSLERTDLQFWEPAQADDARPVPRPVIVEVMRARIQRRHAEMHLMRREWETYFQEFVGLEFHCLLDDMPEYKLWMMQQV